MKNEKIRFLLCALFFIVLAMITFRCVFGENMVFAASDLNIGQLAAKKNQLPDSLTGFFTASPVLGSSGYTTAVFYLILSVLPLMVVAKAYYGLVLLGGSLSLVWFLRIWNRSWTAALVGALIAYWFNSVMLAVGGHVYKMEVLALSSLGFCLVEKAIRATSIRRTVGFSVLTGLSVGVMMIEQQDVALVDGMFVGAYALFRLVQVHRNALLRWIAMLAPIAAVALLLSANAVLKSYRNNIAGAASVQSGGEDKWNFVTQWSMVPSEWPDLIASGWGGWSSARGSEEYEAGPYWGKIGQSADWDESTGQGMRNFKITSKYLGIIPFLLGAYGMVAAFKRRRSEDGAAILFWSVAGVLGLWLAFGKYSLLYKGFYHLPLVGNIRDQSKFLDIFQVCLGIVAAFGLDRLLSAGKEGEGKNTRVKWFSIACMSISALMLIAGTWYRIAPASRIAKFKEMGYVSHAEVMVENMSNAWIHAAVLAFICATLAFLVWKGFIRKTHWLALVFIVVLSADSVLLTTHYFKATDITSIKQGNEIIDFLKKNQGLERINFMDRGGIYNQWVGADGPFHELNLFNIWQMSRMPVDYEQYLSIVGRNQIRLWQLSSIKYIAAPSAIMQQLSADPALGRLFQPVLNYQVPTMQGMRPDVLLEFKATIPRFALYHGWKDIPVGEQCEQLVSPDHNVLTTVLVDRSSGISSQSSSNSFQRVEAEVTKKKATLSVTTDRPAILRFSQHYKQDWQVYVDDQPAQLLQVDYVCMGVQVPPGEHKVEFRCVNATPKVIFTYGVLLGSVGLAVFMLRKERGRVA